MPIANKPSRAAVLLAFLLSVFPVFVHSRTFSHCVDPTCGVEIDPFAQLESFDVDDEVCEMDHIGHTFSACNQTSGTRSLFFFYKAPAFCRGGQGLPAPIENIPCELQCFAGNRLSNDSQSCEKCAAGSYSTGGATRFEEWSSIPPQFTTECRMLESDDSCAKWTPENGTSISSGEHHGVDGIYSIMTLRILLVRDGQISFNYKVDAEPEFDGLRFYVDDFQQLPLVSQQPEWTAFLFALEAGYHTLKWIYSKDFTVSYGQDRAWIKDVEVDGTGFADPTCSPCPVGTYSNTAETGRCKPCPANTYSSSTGAAQCSSCSDDKYSLPGATACQTRRNCTLGRDYIQVISPCTYNELGDAQQVTYYRFQQPIICDTRSFSLPANSTGACEVPCPPGMQRLAHTSACSYCPEGWYSEVTSDGPNCTLCGPGHAAIKSVVYDTFDAWPQLFVDGSGAPYTGCEGGCATSGWQLGHSFMSSGQGHTTVLDIYLDMHFKLYVTGNVTVFFSMECPGFSEPMFMSPMLQVIIDGSEPHSVRCPTTVTNVSFSLPAGDHVVRFNFHKRSYRGTPEDRVLISYIRVDGATIGGGAVCQSCPAGFFSTGNSSACTACPSGTTSSSENGSTSCKACPAGTAALNEASAVCLPCGPGTNSPEGAQECSSDCALSDPLGKKYDLSPLSRVVGMYGPVPDLNGTQGLFFFNVCQRPTANNSCVDDNNVAYNLYSCMLDKNGKVINFGNTLGLQTLPTDQGLGVSVLYLYGDTVDQNGTVVRRSTTINIVCDATKTDVTVAKPVLLSNDGRNVTFRWETAYGCPLCTADDYTYYTTPCSNGQRLVKYDWKNEASGPRCYRGVSLPKSYSEKCPSSVSWTGLIGFSLAAAVVVPGFLILFFKYKKYRNLYSQYESIQDQQRYDRELRDTETFEYSNPS